MANPIYPADKIEIVDFNSNAYGTAVAEALSQDGDGERLIPLVAGVCVSPAVVPLLKRIGKNDFPLGAVATEAARAGLWLYFSCADEAHEIVQDLNSPEACFWHGILHRQEPDAGNAAYWFRKVGQHPIFPKLCAAADRITQRYPDAEFRTGGKWDPFSFIMFCERARQQPGSSQERAALEIQRSEWQLLFDSCAKGRIS